MKTMTTVVAAFASALLLLGAAPAHAEPLPDGQTELYLKDHRHLRLAVSGGAVRLSSDADQWKLESDERMNDLGEYRIVHRDSGRCLAADTSGGGRSVPVTLTRCAKANHWTIIYHDPGHQDFRFVAPGGYLLGVMERADVFEGAKIRAVRSAPIDSMHFHEWRMDE